MELQTVNDTDSNDELFQLMKTQMSSEEEQMFMISHYLYLQHGTDNTKFVVDFDKVWKNVKLSRRDNAKRILLKNFTEHIDYKIAAPQFGGAALANCKAGIENVKNLGGAGLNKELISLTVDCFKNFCMIVATPKAKRVRSYYIKMENVMHEYYKNFRIKNMELQNSLQQSQNSLQVSMNETVPRYLALCNHLFIWIFLFWSHFVFYTFAPLFIDFNVLENLDFLEKNINA
jgi:phage anti-repressor protein